MIKNKDILLIDEILNCVRGYELSLYTKGKVIKNQKAIKEQLEVIKEIQKDLVSDELREKLREYYNKREEFIVLHDLRNKSESEVSEEIKKEFYDLAIPYENELEEEQKVLKEYNDFLEEENEIEISKIDMEKDRKIFEDIKIKPEVDYIVDILFEV